MNMHLIRVLIACAIIVPGACTTPTNTYRGTAIGTAIGAVTGGVIGHQLHHENGRYVGGVTGALIGGAIGNNYDQLGAYNYSGSYRPPPPAPYGYSSGYYPPPYTQPPTPYYR
ncbi:MAG: glycine zipper 2TM domain-containing protein [Gammaproteobacteria bacterium]